jgi:hypothetical protein
MERRVTILERDFSNHQRDCARNWALLMKVIGFGGALALTTIIGVGGWSLNRLYEAQQQQTAALQQLIGHR